jgi:beta-galactosidase/beta-glucuronidase
MKFIITLSFSFFFFFTFAQGPNWSPVPGKIQSKWADQIDISNPLSEYPRPHLVRENWQNLNGLWQYNINQGKLSTIPSSYEGQILVPFPIESSLSGVGKTVGKDQTLWYHKTIDINKAIRKQQVILHFGAVDWLCEVYVNGKKVGSHEGGFDPFSFNITPYLKKGTKQDIVVGVWDPTDEGPQPNGKQVVKPNGIWYTPVTGIWQTVWLEGVPESYIESTKHTPNIDDKTILIQTKIKNTKASDQLRVSIWNEGKNIIEKVVAPNSPISLKIADPQLWSPSNPFLYDLKISLVRNGKIIDEVSSYFAMRKISMGKDHQGIQRMLLNNEFLFQYGPLDQGWWPDGLYTAPTDEALLFDIQKTKEMGFNMIRKHIKVEPARWYYHTDRLGLLVWQDMPSGDLGENSWDMRPGQISGRSLEKNRSPESESIFKKEWKAIMDEFHNFPSIVVWVPFNEAWGQFKTKEITEWTMKYDPSRLVNSASGGNFFQTGHILDIHNYPDAAMPSPDLFGHKQILALGECGGLGLPVDGHTWQEKDNWGYQSFKNKEELKVRYKGIIENLSKLIPLGLSAAVYTQTTDVEIETNGLMTYDRKVIKIPEEELKEIHTKLYIPLQKSLEVTLK